MAAAIITDMNNPDIRTVFHPDRWGYLTPAEVTALQDWLRANGLDPRNVDRAPITAEQQDGKRVIRYTAFLRDGEGYLYRDPATDRTAREERTVPLLVEPPEDWAQA